MRLLRDRRLAALLVAEVVSSIGTQMTWLALPWFVLRTTGSAERMTWVIIAEVLPIAVLGFWGGSIAARVGTRRTMLVCDLARAPLLAAIPALHAADLLPFPLLLLLVAATGVFIAPYFSVQRSIVPELVGENEQTVAEATALFQAASRSALFIGPVTAGFLIAVIGNANVLYVDAASYVVSFTLVALFVHPPEVAADGPPRGALSGVRFLFGDRLLRVWTPAFTLVDVSWQLIFVSLPVLVVTEYEANPRVLGFLMGALGGGALIGAFASIPAVRRYPALTLGSSAFALQMASLWLLVAPGPWVVPLVGMAAAGFFMSNVNAPIQTLVMLRLPREVRTQGIAAFGVLQCVCSPLGLLLAGWALARYDTRSVLTVVLALDTIAVLTFIAAALVERASLAAVPAE
jgi:MFS family permease